MKKFFEALFNRLTIALIVIGCILFIGTVSDTIRSFSTPKTFEDIIDEGIEEGDYIKGEILYSLGSFAVEDTVTTKNGSTSTEKGTAEYFVIPTYDGYAGICIKKKQVSEVSANSDETWDFLEENIDDTTTRPKYEGKVVEMEDELLRYFKSYLKDMGYTQEEINEMGDIYVIENMSAMASRIMTIVGLLLLIGAVVKIIFTMNKANQEAVSNQMNGGYADPNYNNQMNGGYTDPNYNNQMNGGYTDPNYNNQMNGGYAGDDYNNQN